MPFYLLPGDLILAAPLLLFTPATYMAMAVTAGAGGLIPWQAGIATTIGRFQFMLGREVGVSFYGYGQEEDRLLIPYSVSGISPEVPVVAMRTIQVELPFVEYRPFRTFSMDQSTSMVVQLYAGVDIPTKVGIIAPPGYPVPETHSTWSVGLWVAFDWRSYLGSGTGVHR